MEVLLSSINIRVKNQAIMEFKLFDESKNKNLRIFTVTYFLLLEL